MSLPTNFFIGRGGAEGGLYDFPKNNVFQFTTTPSAAVRYGLNLSNTLALAQYNTTTYPWLTDTNFFNITTDGYQLWTVPIDGVYEISARGAIGGTCSRSPSPGYSKGGLAQAKFTLTEGQKITITCGHKGRGQAQASGGGGSFVVADGGNFSTATQSQILVIGGGAGGYSSDNRGDGGRFGSDGGRGHGNTYGAGGSGGSGGGGGRLTDGGGGFDTNGVQNSTQDGADTHGYFGLGYKQGLTGGDGNPGNNSNACTGQTLYQNEGGFGGGVGCSYAANGSGGGYSGGGGSDGCTDATEAAGGGGSFINTSSAYYHSNAMDLAGFNNQHGSVLVTRL